MYKMNFGSTQSLVIMSFTLLLSLSVVPFIIAVSGTPNNPQEDYPYSPCYREKGGHKTCNSCKASVNK